MHPHSSPTRHALPEARPAEGDIDESNPAFAAIPIVDIPRHTLLVLRSIRVVLEELIVRQGIRSFIGYVVVADLVFAMVTTFEIDLNVDYVN